MGFGLDIKKNDQVQVIAGRDKGKVGGFWKWNPAGGASTSSMLT